MVSYCPVAFELGIGFAPVRKPGTATEVISADYEKSMVSIHPLYACVDAQSNQVNVLIDDL